MKARIIFLSLAAALCCGVAQGQDAEKITYNGKVVDINDKPVAGATVRL